VSDDLSDAATGLGRGAASLPATVDAVLADAAATALVSAEAIASAPEDDAGSGRAAALAAGVLAARDREPSGRVAAAVDDLDAAVVRGVAEPRPTGPPVTVAASAAALVEDALGPAAVATVGVLAGRGDVRAYVTEEIGPGEVLTSLGRQSLDRPASDSHERAFLTFGPGGSFALRTAGRADLVQPRPARILARAAYVPWVPEQWYAPVALAAAYDGVLFVPQSRAVRLISQRPRLLVDGAPLAVTRLCYVEGAGFGFRGEFAGGSLTVVPGVSDEAPAAATLVRDGVESVGQVTITFQDTLQFAGSVSRAGGATVAVSGSWPFDEFGSC
jgi:hypothetical protein